MSARSPDRPRRSSWVSMSAGGLTLMFAVVGLVLGVIVGWLASRPAVARLEGQLDRDRALHAERLKTYQSAEASFRDAFASLSAQALNQNNETFLSLAESRLRQARTETDADLDARRKAIEDLLT